MNGHSSAGRYRLALVALATLIGAGASLPAAAQNGRHDAYRHDPAPWRAVRQERINARVAQDNLEMVRRIRCEREAKRAHARGDRGPRCR